MATHLETSSQDWHRADVRAAIQKAGSNLRRLSMEHGYGEDACRKALLNPWPAVERIIADFLRMKPQAIWPSRYDSDGRPISKRRPRVFESASKYMPTGNASNGKAGGRF